LCVDTAESGAEWPFVRLNPAFVRAQFVCARESCICVGLSTGHKYRNVRAQTESASGLKLEKNPRMIPNRANEKNMTRKGFLCVTPRKWPRTPNTGALKHGGGYKGHVYFANSKNETTFYKSNIECTLYSTAKKDAGLQRYRLNTASCPA
jgi:hypothetical protein